MITATIARLRADCPVLKLVDGAAAFTAADKNLPPVGKRPAAYVLPASDRAGENRRVNGVAQQVIETVAVLLCVGGTTSIGGQLQDDVEQVRNAVRDCLVGWQPDPTGNAVEYVSMDVAGAGQRVLWLEMRFRCETHVRA